MRDHRATQCLAVTRVAPLLAALEPPLGLGSAGKTRLEAEQHAANLSLPVASDGTVHYFHVLHAAAYHVSGTKLPGPLTASLGKLADRAFPLAKKMLDQHRVDNGIGRAGAADLLTPETSPGTASLLQHIMAARIQAR